MIHPDTNDARHQYNVMSKILDKLTDKLSDLSEFIDEINNVRMAPLYLFSKDKSSKASDYTTNNGITYNQTNNTVIFSDPWSSVVLLSSKLFDDSNKFGVLSIVSNYYVKHDTPVASYVYGKLMIDLNKKVFDYKCFHWSIWDFKGSDIILHCIDDLKYKEIIANVFITYTKSALEYSNYSRKPQNVVIKEIVNNKFISGEIKINEKTRILFLYFIYFPSNL